jgi:hypothetical protein
MLDRYDAPSVISLFLLLLGQSSSHISGASSAIRYSSIEVYS